ncbi:Ldh family oxidoreductase [Aminobacter sp. MSH1]|uniref:Ldh family oxidoreductase n=1 Tax=Aminobacter sp. MSH1 TaxID=374606 RepID=UPI000D3C8DEB|nr:Ldh family oxidoreductase [Aminobacter sp. MSH1]
MPSVDELRQTAIMALEKVGASTTNAALQVDLLLDAELSGHVSHGLLRLPRLVARIKSGVANPNAIGVQKWRNKALLDVDGEDGLGPVVALYALKQLHERVAETGIAAAAIRNCNHLGMLAWYAEKVAEQGKVLIAFTLSEALVHPWNGSEALIGTNPISIGVPADPKPFVMDMATSQVSMGKIHAHAGRGEQIPEGWALDRSGRPTTDAAAATIGALSPFGGAKGYALGLAFETLVAALTGSAIGDDVVGTLDDDRRCNKGDLFIMINPVDGATGIVSAYLDRLRTSHPSHAGTAVRIPGDRAAEVRMDREIAGVPVELSIWNQIQALAKPGQIGLNSR